MVLTQICFTQNNFSLFVKSISQTRFSFRLHKALKFNDFMNLSQGKMKTEDGCLENTTMEALFLNKAIHGKLQCAFYHFWRHSRSKMTYLKRSASLTLMSQDTGRQGKIRGRSMIGEFPLTECIHVSSPQPPRVEPLTSIIYCISLFTCPSSVSFIIFLSPWKVQDFFFIKKKNLFISLMTASGLSPSTRTL